MTRVAAFDCGTNSLRLLIADVQQDGTAPALVELDRRMEIVRLGQGVDRTGRFDPRALERTLAVVADYAELCRASGVQRTRFVATSATRDAADRDAFVDGVHGLLGVCPEVITGLEEARLSFEGATRGLGLDPDQPVLVVDIGGGSTEVVLGSSGGGIEVSRSVDIGCVRLTERHHGDVASAFGDVEAALDDVARAVPLHRAGALVGVAGSVTTVTAHALGLPSYQSARIHGATLPITALDAACQELIEMSWRRRAQLPYLHPGRVDVIGAGALVWQRVLRRVAGAAGLTEATASEHDILDGIACSIG
jgi:exopolyphosphatase/guanosine-5'-triphosphate,3'-diphosphate pyrophosphatase